MQQPIDTSKYTQAALRKMGYLPPNQPQAVDSGLIAAININSDKPLILEMENGTLFKLGGLSESQKSQLHTLQGELISKRVAFKFSGQFNQHHQPINPRFHTLVIKTGGLQ